jgi:L,D-transpeptidase ErfK/SrfK
MKSFLLLTIALFAISTPPLFAGEFPIPSEGNSLVGKVQYTTASYDDTTTTVSHRYNLGLNSIVAANPGTTETTLSTRNVRVPTAFILPPFPRKGLIINLPEMRMYYYPENSNQVMTYPIGIGKIGNTIPIENSTVTRKTMNPTWIPGPDVRKYNEEQGIDLPRVMPPGPDNPLGPYAIYLSIPSFLIHSTIFPESIGRRASFGCIRMNESDIKDFYPLITPGTEVVIVNMPNKVGWSGNHVYIESHPILEEHNPGTDKNLQDMVETVEKSLPRNGVTLIDWQMMAHLAEEPDGVPHEIGVRIR